MPKFKISKRNRSVVVGLACGLACALCVGTYVSQVNEQATAAQAEMLAKYGGDQIDVCVAKRDILAGETILDGDVETKTWIATLLPVNAVTEKREAVGKQAGSTILSGEVISSARFGFDTAEIEVPSGLVAVSVPTREVQAVGGALAAGMTTDVYAVGPSSTVKLASSVQVLATSMSSEASSSSTASAWVTLAVQPKIVQELVTASENLQIYFTLPSAGVSDEDDGKSEDRSGNSNEGEAEGGSASAEADRSRVASASSYDGEVL